MDSLMQIPAQMNETTTMMSQMSLNTKAWFWSATPLRPWMLVEEQNSATSVLTTLRRSIVADLGCLFNIEKAKKSHTELFCPVRVSAYDLGRDA